MIHCRLHCKVTAEHCSCYSDTRGVTWIKLEFLKFDGENPMGWIRQAEKYFTLAETPEHKKVKFAEVFLVGKADHWLRSTGINTNALSWHEFSALITSRFAAETSLESINTFRHIEQSSNLNTYIDNFEEIMSKLKVQSLALPDEYFVSCFISGWKDHIKIPLTCHNPATLVQAYALARNYEAYQQRKSQSDTPRSGYRYPYQPRQSAMAGKKEDIETKQTPTTKWEKGKCFKCQEPWVPGHNKVCKFKTQMHLIAI
jgi:hypothetical protein